MGFISGEKDYFDESAFEPKWSKEQTQSRVDLYKRVPHTFTQFQLDNLNNHTNHYGIEIGENDATAKDDSVKLKRLLSKLGSGFLSGFTTFEVGDEPRNDAEAIASSLGHLAGFVGYIPTAPLKILQANKLVNAAQAIKGKSVPMFAATKIQEMVAPTSKTMLAKAMTMRNSAVADAAKFLNKDIPTHMIEGAFHLGTASAVGAWQQGIDAMVQSGTHGAFAGGAFRGIANMINSGGARTLVKTVEKDFKGRPMPAKQILTLDQKKDKALRGLAGSLFDGLPSTLRGDTTAQQVYSYLLGAYFGAQETTAVEMGRNKFLAKMDATNSEKIRDSKNAGLEKGLKGNKLLDFINKETSNELNFVPELTPGWGKLSENVQTSVKEEASNIWGLKSDSKAGGLKILEDLIGKDEARQLIDEVDIEIPKEFEDTGNIQHGDRLIQPIKGTENKYIMGSGAAPGADSFFAKEFIRFGGDPEDVYHYSFKGHKGKDPKAEGNIVTLSPSQLSKANLAYEKASERLDKKPRKIDKRLLKRNYFQVLHSDGVFAVGEIQKPVSKGKPKGEVPVNEVKGGTGWAIAMAKDMQGKEIHVYDYKAKQWNKWNRKKRKWDKEETPKLTNDFAGIGTRGISVKNKGKIFTKDMKKAITDVFQKTFGDPIQKTDAQKAQIKAEKKKLVSTIGSEKSKAKTQKITTEEGLGEPTLDDILNEASVEGGDIEPLNKSKKGEDSNINSAIDASKSTSSTPVTDRSVNFVKFNMKELHDNDTNKIYKLSKTVDKILNDASGKSYKDGLTYKIDDAMRVVEKGFSQKLNTALSKDQALVMRQQLFMRNAGVQTPIFTVTNGKLSPTPIARKNLAGNDKRQRAPQMWLSHVYNANGGKGQGFAIVDNFVESTERGFKELTLSQYKEKYTDKNGSDAAFRKKLALINKDMSEKHGMYTFGGRGDSDRLYYVKYHPKTPLRDLNIKTGIKDINADLGNMSTWIKKNKVQGFNKKEIKNLEKKYKRMIISNALYEAEMNGFTPDNAGIKKLIGMKDRVGMKKGVIDWNKRQQIWFTGGYSADRSFFLRKDVQKKYKLGDLSDNKFKFILFEDAPGKGLTAKSLAKEYTEATDGAILAEEGFVNALNESFGMPYSGQNKSFIVSPHAKEGALLGKFMFHKASSEASKWMRDNNVHMVIPRSAAKQSGNREYFELPRVLNKGPYFTYKGRKANPRDTDYVYDMDIADIKGQLSEKDTEHQLQNQRLPKQMLTNLTSWAHSTMGDPAARAKYERAIDDLYNETIGEQFKGDNKFNTDLQDLMDNYSKYSKKDVVNKVEHIIKNIDKVGVNQLLKAMKTPYAQEFTTKAYRRILKKTDELVMDQLNDGEISTAEANDYYQESVSFRTVMDRLMRIESELDNSIPIYYHKFVRDYRMQAMRNFVVYQATRPTMPNSLSSRMRPYDPWMRNDPKFKEMDKKDTIFYLDDMYKEMKIELPKGLITGKKKPKNLGELWDLYQSKVKNKESIPNNLRDYFNTVVMRVPMDSLSGAHDLNFRGFTGIDGKGIMLHPRVMRALGGADLDGDKAFAFFGMKRKYRDLYGKNKDEFLGKDGIIKDNKEDFRDILTDSDPDALKMFQTQSSVWDPYLREEISMRAVDGSNRLGPAVINRQSLIAMHSALASNNINDNVRYTVGKGRNKKEFDIKITAKTDDKSLAHSRELLRATIAFPSDPLDEAGLKSKDVFTREAFNSLFDIKIPTAMKKALGKTGMKKFEDKGIMKVINNSTFGQLKKMNSAYFGKNWDTGRRWHFSEIQNMTESIGDWDSNMRNTMLPKIVKELENSDWTDNIFRRMDMNEDKKGLTSLDRLYSEHNSKENLETYNKFKKQLGRASFSVPQNDIVKQVLKNKLFLANERMDTAESKTRFRKAVSNTHIPMEDGFFDNIDDISYRIRKVEELYALAENKIVEDMSDITTFEMLREKLDGTKIERRNVEKISKFAQEARRQTTLAFQQRKNITEADLDNAKETSFEDQLESDEYIRRFKNGKGKDGKGTNSLGRKLSAEEQDLLDTLLIGTADRFKLDKLEKLKKKKGLTARQKQLLDIESYNASGTSLNRSGFNSTAVNEKVIKDLLQRYSTKLVSTFEAPKPYKEAKAKNDKDAESPLKLKVKDAENNEMEVEVEHTPYSGFEKLREANVSDKEFRSLIDMLSDNVTFYRSSFGDNAQERGENLNLLTRGVVGKDLVALNKEDYRVLNRYFNDMRSGTWWMKNIVPLMKQKGIIPKRAYGQFPMATSKERMMNDFKLSFSEGYFQNYNGTGKIGRIAKPTHYLERQQYYTARSTDFATKYDDEQKELLRKELNEQTGYESIKEGESLYEIAVALREKPLIQNLTKEMDGTPYDAVRRYQQKQYQDSLKETLDKFPWDDWENKTFSVQLKDKTTNLTGKQIVERINKVITERNQIIHEKWISPNDKFLGEFKDGSHDKDGLIPSYDIDMVTEYISNKFREGKPLNISDFGLDGLRQISRSMMLQSTDTNTKLSKAILNQDVKDTGQFKFEEYYPHAHMDNKKAIESLKRGLDFIEKSDLEPAAKEAEKKKMLVRVKTLTGDWLPHDMIEHEAFDGALREIAEGRDGDWLKWFNSNPRTGNMMSRNNHIGGWAKDPGVYEIYQNNLIKTFYRQISQIMNRKTIQDFRTNNAHKGEDFVRAWENFYKLYAQDAMGFPVNIPQSFLKPESNMNIAGTPYAWWSDSNVKRIVNNFRKKLGINEDARLPEELQGIDVSKIRHWSNLEARYQMATLLAHPKSAVANIYGGTVHTIQSSGWQNFKNARNVEYLRTNLPGEAKKWESKDDITKWSITHGVVPDFVLYEAGLNPQFRKGRFKAFLSDAMDLLKRDPSVKDSTLLDIAKKHKITENAFHKAAWFMREPERMLRRDSFVSHYLQARENIGSAEMDLNHPFLIEKAKKGVQATQFLYSAPFRPSFARSSLGKVMTRFQLWAWNSVRFRKDVINDAALHGFRQGTPEFERYKRIATTDMFVLALSNIFAYSIFENALPAPYSWFQDTADWLFGDEKARDRAFFGAYPSAIAPLQVITPPIARIGPATFSAIANNDWSRISDYYIHTMYPFGRMFRDVRKSAENPIRTVENMTGIPYGQFHRYVKSLGAEEDVE